MAQDVISTLFGITPRNTAFDKYTEDRMIDVNKAGSQYTDLGRANIERASAMMQNAGTGIGIGIGRLLGGQTPQMAEEQRVQGMLGGASLQDPEQLMMAAERFAQAGDIPRAQALAGQAQTMPAARIKEQEARDAKAAADAKAQATQTAYQNRMRALQSRFPNMPEVEAQALAADEAAFRKLFEDQQIKFSNTVEEISKELFNKPFNQLSSAEAQQVNLLKEQREGSKAAKGAVRVTVNGREEESEFAKQLGKVQATRLGAAYDKRDAALRELSTFEQLATLPDTQLISGSLAEPRVEIANFLVTAGLASSQDAQRVSASQQFQKLSNDLVLARVKQLGYNPSDADRKFIEQTIPRLSSSATARKQLMAFMAKVARDVSDEVSSMESYATSNKTLTGYKPKIPQVSMGAPTKSVSSMTDEELLKALQNSKK